MHARDVIPEGGGLRVAFYGRHSTDRQDINAQISAARRFCEAYNCEFDETMTYHDLGVSARKTPMQGRPGLVNLLEAIRNGEIDLVVAYSDSRLARDPVEHAQIRLALDGVPVVLCDTETVYNPLNVDIVTQMIRDGVSKFEVDQTVERTRDAAISRVKHGQRIGGRTPFGYTYTETIVVVAKREKKIRHYVVDPAHKWEIQEVYRRYARGEGFSKIAAALGWFKRDNKTPHKERPKLIIINPFYAGYVSMYKVKSKSRLSVQPIEKWHYAESPQIEPVISFDQWFECFRLYEKKRSATIPPRYFKTSFLLTGLLKCEHHEEFLKTASTVDKEPTPMVGDNTIKHVRDTGGKVVRTNGKREYVCKKCKRRLDAVEVHHEVLHTFLVKHLTRTPADEDRLRSAVIESISNEKAGYEQERDKSIRRQKSLQAQLDTASTQLRELLENENSTRWGSLIEEYRRIINKEVDRQKDLQKQLKQRMAVLREVAKSPTYLIKVIRENALREQALRTLLLSMVKQVLYTSDEALTIDAWVGEL